MNTSKGYTVAIGTLALLGALLTGCMAQVDHPKADSSSSSPAGSHPIYRSYKVNSINISGTNYNGIDFVHSNDQAAAASSGYTSLGTVFNLFDDAGSTRTAIYSCVTVANSVNSHFISTDNNCGGSIIGYVEKQNTGSAITPLYKCAGYPAISGVTDTGNPAALTNGLLTVAVGNCIQGQTSTLVGYIN
jgi:hypothetical protein